MTRISPKEKILGLIEKSADETRRGKTNRLRRILDRPYMRSIGFRDIMDIVLYYISLQPDMEKITRIKSRDFYELLEKAWEVWGEKVEKRWGYKHYEDPPDSGQMHKTLKFYALNVAWSGGSGPGGGTMGTADRYALMYPGFMHHDYLLLFFTYPRELPDKEETWPYYRKYQVKAQVFPKWRRKEHRKKLEMVFELAEMVCERLREKGPAPRSLGVVGAQKT